MVLACLTRPGPFSFDTFCSSPQGKFVEALIALASKAVTWRDKIEIIKKKSIGR
jgi:hypothetical protein